MPSKPVVRIGFPFASYPRIFKNHLGKWVGIHVDVWEFYAQSIGAVVEFAYPDFQHFGPDDPEVDGKFVSGVLGLMQNDSIDAAIDYTLQQGRMGNFQYMPQYDYQPMNLIHRERVITASYFDRIGDFIASFGGFSVVMTLNMLAISASTIFLTYYTAALPSTTKTYGVRFCIVFNAFVFFTLYNATIAGINLMISLDAHKDDSFQQFIFGTETPNDFSITVLPTKQEVVARLCADDSAIYFDYLRDFVEFYNDDVGASICTLTTVTNDLNVEDKYTIGVNLGKTSPIVNYFRADRIRKRKQLEFVIL
ncbi:hypothetical protein PRIPAC_96135 [Pristionchus pacificus]|uniref:Uncharacterized protein n=1 Tax=Pristionchus pacificus TaxID=54126 RepID=A0A2A6B3A7_PRIPA|nr:hypothetical protein PRIPAC_96135 [Pristionchus pacificus]|eukprot:PDM60354.1 hypothetical protein PRIPAC_54179 [Pristionchus pacificus]